MDPKAGAPAKLPDNLQPLPVEAPAPAPLADAPAPAPDVQFPQPSPAALIIHQDLPVRRPSEDIDDFVVPIRATVLSKCRARLSAICKSRFPWYEVWLAVFALSFGALLGALPAGFSPCSKWFWIFYVALPMVAVGSGVAYWCSRKSAASENSRAANDTLNDLPDPKDTK